MAGSSTQVFNEVDGKQVISSGNIIAHIGQSIRLRPFPDYPTYILDFIVEISIGGNSSTKTSPDPENDSHNIIISTATWSAFSKGTSNKGIAFADSDEAVFSFAYFCKLAGVQDNYNIVLTYNVIMDLNP